MSIPVPTHLITAPRVELNRITADLVLWIPRPPDNANARGHWAKADRVRRTYQHELSKRLSARLLPPPPDRPSERVRISAIWYYQPPESRSLDEDNAQRRLKPAIDWLVRYGYLPDDNAAHVTWGPMTQLLDRPPADAPPLASVRLTLTPIEP